MADWSRLEVEATVEDYFSMLDAEIRGDDYNKSAHRRHLSTMLDSRSHGAIERKHQNISAILIELGFVYIAGYKPLGNYQQLLFDVVEERLRANRNLRARVEAQVTADATVPEIDDILDALVRPPTPRERAYPAGSSARAGAGRRVRPGVDYLEMEARNRSLGAAGEEFALRYEVARLDSVGQGRLAARVEHVSKTRGDGTGFDILSFEESGRERLIEVKTTRYGDRTPFFVSRNEVEVSRERTDHYHLYRAYDFRRNPRLFCLGGRLDRSFQLDPVQFMARIA